MRFVMRLASALRGHDPRKVLAVLDQVEQVADSMQAEAGRIKQASARTDRVREVSIRRMHERDQ